MTNKPIKLSKLKSMFELNINQVKNYKDMCKLLNQKETTGNARILQLINWKRYFEYEKDGHKFIIIKIYKRPIRKIDGRSKGNNRKNKLIQ